jgi:hypothetical protein
MSRTEVSDCLILFWCLVVKLIDNTKGYTPLCSNQLSSNLAYFKLRIPAPTQVSLSLLHTCMHTLVPAHKKFSGQRIEFNPCKIATTACQAVVYEIRFTFFFFFFSLSIQEYQGYEIDLTYLRTYGTFDASVLLT